MDEKEKEAARIAAVEGYKAVEQYKGNQGQRRQFIAILFALVFVVVIAVGMKIVSALHSAKTPTVPASRSMPSEATPVR